MTRVLAVITNAGAGVLRRPLLAAAVVGSALALIPSSSGAAGAALDCSGSTVYAVNRPATQEAGTHGIIFALSASTVGGATATMTEVSAMPGNSYPNALGISAGGKGLYAVDQKGTTGTANVWAYNTSSETWTSHAGSGGLPSGYVAGAVDPVNGIYYYADYTAGTASTPGKATLYGFNTETNTAIAGTITTFNLPDGNSAAAQNGDFTFDGDGNLFVLASDGKTRGIGVIKAANIPSTGEETEPAMTTLSSVADTNTYNGIAFDNLGHLYLEGSAAGTFKVTDIDPNNGEVLAGPTAYSANAQINSDVDLASCAKIPTLTSKVKVEGRYESGDQFHLSITGGTITEGNTGTTSGSATGVQPQFAGPVIGNSGTEYTFTETASKGSLANYNVTYSCVDTANGNSAVASGTGSTFKLKFPSVTLGQASPAPDVLCTFTTTPKKIDLAVTDSVSPESLHPGEQVTYTLKVKNNGPDEATGTTLTDTLPAGVKIISAEPSQGTCTTSGKLKCALGALASGASSTVTVLAEVLSSTSPGTLEDAAETEAEQTDTVPSNNKAHATLKVTALKIDLAVTDTVSPESTLPGKQVIYTLKVVNNGPDGATGTTLTDTLPAGVKIISAESSQGTCTTSGKLKCALGTFANKGSATITVIAEVLSSTAPGTLEDAAETEAEQTDTVPSNNKAHATLKVTAPKIDLAVTDTVSPETTHAGETVTYTLKVKNNGPDEATGASLSDTLPAGVKIISTEASQGTCTTSGKLKCALGALESGATATVTVVAEVLSSTAPGTLEDAASTEAEQTDTATSNNKAHSSVKVIARQIDLAVTDTVSPETTHAGETVTYTLKVKNNGPDEATGASLSDTLPAGLKIISTESTQGTCTTSGKLKCALGALESGATATVTVVAEVLSSTAPGTLEDAASTEAEQTDTATSNNKAHSSVKVIARQIDLAVTDTVSPEVTKAGTQVTYTLKVTNNGPDEATGSKLTDTLPAGLKIISAESTQGTCTTSGKLKCALGTLANKGSATITVLAEVIEGTAPGTLQDAAETEAEQTDTVPSNNKAHATLKVTTKEAELAVTDTVSPEATLAGNQVTYTLTVANNGPDNATGTTLIDTLPAGVRIISAEPSQGTCSTTSGLNCALGAIANGAGATVTVIAEVIEGATGTLEDATSVSSNQADPIPSNNVAHATVTVTPPPEQPAPPAPPAPKPAGHVDLQLTTTVNHPEVAPGEEVTYTVTVTNAGTEVAPGVIVINTPNGPLRVLAASSSEGACFVIAGIVSCQLPSLEPGHTITIVVRGVVTGPGSINLLGQANVLCTSAGACPTDINPANNAAPAAVTAAKNLRLHLTEKVSRKTIMAGHSVWITLSVKNPNGDVLTHTRLCTQLPPGLVYVSSPHKPQLRNGSLCWKLGTLGAHGVSKIHLLARALRGAAGLVRNKAVATATEVSPAHARGHVTIIAVAEPGPALVTG